MSEGRKIAVFMPLKYWLLILAVIVVLFLVFYHHNSYVLRKQDVMFENSLSKEWEQLNPEKKQVVILGSSLFRFAFPLNERKLSDEVDLLTFSKNGGKIYGFDQFVANGIPVIPELLIIQADMLTDDRGAVSRYRHETLVSLRRLRSKIKGVKVKDISTRLRGRVVDREIAGDCKKPVPPNERKSRSLKLLYGNSVAPFRGVKSRLSKLQDAGIKLVLLSIPRSPTIETQIQSELAAWNNYIADLSQDLDIPIIRYPSNFKDSGFCDGVHMNKSSREKHAAWLKEQIKELLDDAS